MGREEHGPEVSGTGEAALGEAALVPAGIAVGAVRVRAVRDPARRFLVPYPLVDPIAEPQRGGELFPAELRRPS